MIVVTKNNLQTVNVTLNGPLAEEAGYVSGWIMVQWIADETGESICMKPISATTTSWRQTQIQFAEGTDDPMIGYVILTGTNRHWTYKIWKCPFPIPEELPDVPFDSTLVETGRVWVEGADLTPIDEIYK
jgi:hypothetical protein